MTEQQPYEVLAVLPGFELRHYPAHAVAQVTVRSTLDAAGNAAFRYLFGYISGQNQLSPPPQEAGAAAASSSAAGEDKGDPPALKIPMTAPVLLHPQAAEGIYTVAFVLPESMTEDAAPYPKDPAVSITTVGESRGAAAAFSGRWTSRNYMDHAADLGTAIEAAGLTPVGLPRFALFDPPFKPWFLRRNEVIQTVE